MLYFLEHVVDCLRHGIVPRDDEAKHVCAKIAIVYVSLTLAGDELGDPIVVHVIDHDTDEGIVLDAIDPAWTRLINEECVVMKKKIASVFSGVCVYPVTSRVDVYAAYKKLLTHCCARCKEAYRSDINRARCEGSHTDRKKIDARREHPIAELAAFWDSLATPERQSIAASATKYLAGVPYGCSLAPQVARLVRLAAGKVELTGHQLMVSLDVASENTCMFKLVRQVPCDAPVTRGDYIAAMAVAIVNQLVLAHAAAAAKAADAVAHALLEECSSKTNPKTNSKKRTKKTKAKKQPRKMSGDDDGDGLTIVEDCSQSSVSKSFDVAKLDLKYEELKEVEEKYAKQAYYNRIEKLVWSTPAATINISWADL